jgi:hypothetical protein
MEGMAPKRTGPPDVQPLVIDDLRIEAVHWGKDRGLKQNGGYIEVFKHASNHSIWLHKVYDIEYDPKMESDVQDLFIVSIELDASGQRIIIKDEAGAVYTVNLSEIGK